MKHEGHWLVRFQGREYVLMDGGALTTKALFAAGEASYAHVFPECGGAIMRFNEQIGTVADLEWISPTDLDEPDDLKFSRGFAGGTWEAPTIDVEGVTAPVEADHEHEA